MDGKRVTVVGQVSHRRNSFTKEGKPFASVSLDLLGGSVEVMVWSNSYDRTQHLWYEGSLVQIAGRARLRGEELSLSCDEASAYAPDEEGDTARSQEPDDRGHGRRRLGGPHTVRGSQWPRRTVAA